MRPTLTARFLKLKAKRPYNLICGYEVKGY